MNLKGISLIVPSTFMTGNCRHLFRGFIGNFKLWMQFFTPTLDLWLRIPSIYTIFFKPVGVNWIFKKHWVQLHPLHLPNDTPVIIYGRTMNIMNWRSSFWQKCFVARIDVQIFLGSKIQRWTTLYQSSSFWLCLIW